ncbi:MAG: multidrug effflux MFS transporter [Burkholderiales bacterium]
MPYAHLPLPSDGVPRRGALPGGANPNSPALQVLLGGVMSILPLALDSTLPALPAIQESFLASATEVQATVSAYLVGVATSQLLYGPLADRFGRRPVLICALGAYVAAAVLSALAATLAYSLSTFVVLRFVQGAAAVCGPVLARTIVRDLAADELAARLLARITLAFAVATIIGPLLGGALVTVAGWASIFWMLAAWGALLFAGVAWRLPETAPEERQAIAPARVAANFALLLSQRAFLAPTVLALASQLGVFVFVTNSALVLVPVLGYTPAQYALLFALVMLGHIAGVQIANRLVLRHGIVAMLHAGAQFAGVGGALLALLGLFEVRSGAWLAPAMALVMLGNGLIMPNATAAAMSRFPLIAGAAASLQAMAYQVGGAVVGLLVSLLFDGTPRPLFFAVALCSLAALALERWLFRSNAKV